MCCDCKASGPWKETGQEAVKFWNHRTPDTELVKALRGAVYAFNNFTDAIDNPEISNKVVIGIINADRVLAKYKENK